MNQFLALSVVLTLVSGLNAAWMCGPSCGPETAATACEHQPFTTSARLTAAAHCSLPALAPAPVPRDDVRRILTMPIVLPETAARFVGDSPTARPPLAPLAAPPAPLAPLPLRI